MNAPSPARRGLFDALHWAVPAHAPALVTLDAQQVIVLANPAALDLFGHTDAARLLGQRLSGLGPPRLQDEQARQLQGWMAAAQADPAAAQDHVLVAQRADGREVTLALSVSPLVSAQGPSADGAGPASRFMVLLRDLSGAGPLPEEQIPLGERLRRILDLAPTAIWIADGEQIAFANRACAALFGAADHRLLLGRSIYSLLMPESHAPVRRGMAQALAPDLHERPPIVSERIARLDGAVRDVEIAMAAMPDHGHTTLQMVISDTTERKRADRAQEDTRRELRQLTASLVEAREAERRRIARELHDELGQRLTALKLELATLRAPTAAAGLPARLPLMLAMVDDTVAAVRRIATELRPAVLDDLGLNAAIEGLVKETARRLGLAIQLVLPPHDPAVDETTAIALYRMVQEALTNIARHARATEVVIALQCDAQAVTLLVQDNGRGFSKQPMARRGSHGLVGLRERCHMLGGQIEFDNAPGSGARVRVQLPLVAARPDGVPDNPPVTQPDELFGDAPLARRGA